MFIGSVVIVIPVITMARINTGQIPTITKRNPSVIPISAKKMAIKSWIKDYFNTRMPEL